MTSSRPNANRLVRVVPIDFGEHAVMVDGERWGILAYRPSDGRVQSRADLFLFSVPGELRTIYLAAEYSSPSAMEEMADFIEWLACSYSLGQIHRATHGRLGLHRDMGRLKRLLIESQGPIG